MVCVVDGSALSIVESRLRLGSNGVEAKVTEGRVAEFPVWEDATTDEETEAVETSVAGAPAREDVVTGVVDTTVSVLMLPLPGCSF